jgi:predicted Zn-dependent peptidase
MPSPRRSASQKIALKNTIDNGLHVILHHDPSAPVVITSVMYHVGSKDENPEDRFCPLFSTFMKELKT